MCLEQVWSLDQCIDEFCTRNNIQLYKPSIYKLLATPRHIRAIRRNTILQPIFDNISLSGQRWEYCILISLNRKQCAKCALIKDISQYNKTSGQRIRNNYRSECKDCQSLTWQEYYKNNTEKIIQSVTKRKRNLDRDLTLTEIQLVFERDGNVCQTCGLTNEEHLISYGQRLHLDHILPVSKGGLTTIENLQLLCRSCNSKKSNN